MLMLDRQALCDFVNVEIVKFHQSRLGGLKRIKLDTVLIKKNPYLFRAKNVLTASEFITGVMNAFLSSSEEECFGQFLENLAIYVAKYTNQGWKSSAHGIDLEFDRNNTRYIIAVKSGPNWGNSSQYKRLEEDFKSAARVLRQSSSIAHVQPILGICYGKVP